MSTSEKKRSNESENGGTFDAAARAMGRAVGYFRRLYKKEPDGETKKEKRPLRKAPPKTRSSAKSRTAPSKVPASLDRQARAELELNRLEEELDRIYAAIASGASTSNDRPGAATSELSDLIDRARELKEQLNERRTDLARLERAAARERALKRTQPPKAQAEPSRQPAPDATTRQRGGRKSDGRLKRRKVEQPPRDPAAEIRRQVSRLAIEDESVRLVVERMARNLTDADADVRRTAAVRLGELDLPAASGLLIPLVADPTEKVSIAALNALVRLGSPSSTELFKKHLTNSNLHIRLAAIRGLAKVGGDGLDHHLIEALEDEEPIIRKNVATLLGWRESQDAVRPLLSTLRDEDPNVRAAAATALGALRTDRAVLSLIRTLLDPSPEVRKAAHGALKTTLGREVAVDLEGDETLVDASRREQQVEALRRWWRAARVEKHLERDGVAELPEGLQVTPPAGPALAQKPPPAAAEEPPSAVDVAEPAVEEKPKEEFESLLPEAVEEEEPEVAAAAEEEVKEPEPEPEPVKEAKPAKKKPKAKAKAAVEPEPAPEPAADEPAAEEDYESLLDASFGEDEEGEGEGEGEEYESLLDADLDEPAPEEKKAKKKS
jgi:HEAT repeat protein